MTPVFRKPTLAVLLLSATVLAGCATSKTLQFSYDADVPALPVVQTAVSENRPRPLHTPPAWAVARGGQTAGTPSGRVERANAAARVEPRREGYYNSIQIYPGPKARSIRSMPHRARSPALPWNPARA